MRVFVVAGEASGDKLGAALMEGLRKHAGEVQFDGVGGERMQAAGLKSLFPMDEISIMGITEILSQYRKLKARIRETADAVLAAKPDVLVTIDLPEFGLRVAKLVKEQSNIRTVHYVAPTVWAWRPGRAKKMARFIDHVLALLPFEPPYMEAEGMRCDFVGHPVVTDPVATGEEIAQFRSAFDVGDAPVALVLPGSRRSEVSRLLPIFREAIERLHAQRPGLRFVLPVAPNAAHLVTGNVQEWPVPVTILNPTDFDPDRAAILKRSVFAAADIALAASGTVSLELAAANTPMVIAYDMNWLSRQIIGRMLRVDTVTLVNLVSDTRVVPEFIGANCRPAPIADALMHVLDAPDEQTRAMSLTMERLGRGGVAPGERAAIAVLDGLNETRGQKA
ncbi:lipid-A-disaccharide synthase [Marivita hallyeonensis]|nr:lipid-A-disaccharide synthase [Marivita hallyeonensis]